MPDLNRLYDAILSGKLEAAQEVTQEAIASHIDPQTIINDWQQDWFQMRIAPVTLPSM